MSRKGNCWDNAVVESFFSSLDIECENGELFPSKSAARREVSHRIYAARAVDVEPPRRNFWTHPARPCPGAPTRAPFI